MPDASILGVPLLIPSETFERYFEVAHIVGARIHADDDPLVFLKSSGDFVDPHVLAHFGGEDVRVALLLSKKRYYPIWDFYKAVSESGSQKNADYVQISSVEKEIQEEEVCLVGRVDFYIC